MSRKQLNLKPDPDWLKRLEEAAQRTMIPKTRIVEEAVTRYLDLLENKEAKQ